MDRRHDDVVEVQGVGLAQAGLVERVRLGEGLLEAVGGLSGEGLLVDQLVLEVGDLGGEGLRRIALGVQVQIAADQGHQALGVGGVVDRERRGEAELLRLAAQDADARAVEGHDPHGVGARAHQLLDALLHLARGLVGEGDREDLPRVDPALGQQVGDAVGEHPGLAGTGPGDDEQRRTGVHDGGALLGVQPVEQRGGVDDRARVTVPVVPVPGRRGRVEDALEESLRHRFGCVLLGGRRRAVLRGLEAGQEVVVKEAAHRPPSLGGRTDNVRPKATSGRRYGRPPRTDGERTSTFREGAAGRRGCGARPGKRSRKCIGHIAHPPSQRRAALASVLGQVIRSSLRRTASHGHLCRIRAALPAVRNRGPTRRTGVNRSVPPPSGP